MASFELPKATERVALIGRTGSGKTRMGAWLLSHAPFTTIPYVIVDYKGEKLFDGIDRLNVIDFGTVPKHPGIYSISPRPDQEAETEAWLWKVWERGRIGLFFDETMQIPGHYKKGAFRAILTQGRSKSIPTIMATQRPAGISTEVFSEADHFSVFHLTRLADLQRVAESTTDNIPWGEPLPEYHSRWYDVKRDAAYTLGPVEPDDVILDRINFRLKPRRRLL